MFWNGGIEHCLYGEEVEASRGTTEAPQLGDVDVEDRTGEDQHARHRPKSSGVFQESHDGHKHEERDGLGRPYETLEYWLWVGGEQGVGHLSGERLDAKLDGEDVEGEDGDPEVEVYFWAQETFTGWVKEEAEGGQADAGREHTEEEQQTYPDIYEKSCHEEVGQETKEVNGHGKVVACVVFINITLSSFILGGAVQGAVLRGEHLEEELFSERESGEVLETGNAED